MGYSDETVRLATYVLDATTVVDDDNVEGGILPAVPAPEEVTTDASEAIDGHLELGHRLPSVDGRPCTL